MAIESERRDDEWWLVLSGVVDIFDATALHAAALEAADGAVSGVVLDFREVETLDTSSAQILVALRRSLTAGGRRLRVEGARPEVLAFCQHAGVPDLGA